MNAMLLTVLALGGADASGAYTSQSLDGPAVPTSRQGVAAGGYSGACDACASGRNDGNLYGCLHGWCGPMPQSCYNPSFGCYPSTRYMHRYPAFHNTYYRTAYNYRQYFDYPTHAGLHEPTSMFSYHVAGENAGQGLPTPVPVPAAARNMPTPARSASSGNAVLVPVNNVQR